MDDSKKYSDLNISIEFHSDKGKAFNLAFIKAIITYQTISPDNSSIQIEETESDFISINSIESQKTVAFNKIPAGKDRLVTIKTYDTDKKELPAFNLRAATDILPDSTNKVVVSNKTTAFADVLYGIKNIFNFEELEQDGRMDTIRKVIDSSIHPHLYNSSKLIGELQGFSFPYSSTKKDYILKTGSITFDYLLKPEFDVIIDDPISSPLQKQKASTNISIKNIGPGNWILKICDSDGNLLDKTEVQIESSQNSNLGHIDHNGIALFVSGKDNLESLKTQNPQAVNYQKDYSFFDNSSLFDFENLNHLDFLSFNIAQTGVYVLDLKGLTVLTRIKQDKISFDKLKIEQDDFLKCFIDDDKNKRFIVLLSEKLYGSRPQSVKAEFNKGINDHNGEYKGKHYQMTRNNDGFWYCAVPYIDVQATNQSGQPTYNFKVDNEIITPPKFVPDGFVYQKFNGPYPGLKFLCLIYNSQNQNEISRRLSLAKRSKSLKDFDLDSIQGQMQIANFRLVPGTKNLYRSFHPYNDEDKKNISDTSQMRMKYVKELSEKYNVKADINLSDNELKTATYEMPEFYKKIIESNLILYMTDCNYSQCYETPDSRQFANGIKKIVQFVNKTPGPYITHCALGTDRTGIVCAVLSGLCGASWNDIQEDYCKSIEMGIYEYRGPGAVKYSIQKLLGVDFLEDVPDLQKVLTDYFVKGGYLTYREIEQMKERL